jgi:uncharacterized protein
MLRALAVLAALGVAPAPQRYVEDTAGMMTAAARTNLDERLAHYERATGHQVIVWTGTSREGAALDQWANETFAAWKLGRKGIDDGVALFVFEADRQIAIEVGYGLEDRVTDALASRIIRETMAPKLREGDRDEALTAGANAILAAIEGKPWEAAPSVVKEPAAAEQGFLTYVIGGVVLVMFLLLAFKHPRAAMALMFAFMPGRHRGGGGGGGFGGFGGGGGGRSGGGGARGGW